MRKRCTELDPENANFHYDHGHALQRMARFDESVVAYKKGLGALIELVGHFPRKDFDDGAEQGFDHDRAGEALLDIQKVFAQLERPFFLAFGTALGAIREGGLLSHDQDLDIGFWRDGDSNRVAEAFLAEGFTLTEYNMSDTLLDDGLSRIPLRHPNGIYIDAFPHMREDDGQVWCCLNEGATRLAWSHETFGLREVEMSGSSFNVPNPPERYLDEYFGPDWRQRDLFFEGTVNAHNLVGGFPPIARSYAWYFMMRRLLNREWQGGRYLFDFLCEKFPDDAELQGFRPAFDEADHEVVHARTYGSADA